MVNKRYVAGRAYEYRVKAKLEKEGWNVTRSAGSHGDFDLIAIHIPFYDDGHNCDEYGPHGVFTGQICKDCGQYNFGGNLGTRRIKLIQLKTGKSSKRAKKEVSDSGLKERFEGLYTVSVEVM